MLASELQNKRVALWGYGREGKAVARFLAQAGLPPPALFIDEPGERTAFTDIGEMLSSTEELKDFNVIIKSPGVSFYRLEVTRLLQLGVRFTSATNLALATLDPKKVIGVTGTKGKSTTASLIAHFLKHLGKNVVLAGNIGLPLLDAIDQKADYYVVELSSYQLADLEYFPRLAVLTNIYRDHLSWHGSLERYQEDKCRLFRAAGVVALLNQADPLSLRLGHSLGTRANWYNSAQGFHLSKTHFQFGNDNLFTWDGLALAGEHNRINVLAALTTCQTLGLPVSRLADSFPSFVPLPHRLSLLGTKDGLTYVDDSISTVPETALAALRCFPKMPVTLLLGGLDRGQDWEGFASALKASAPEIVIALPDNGKHIIDALKNVGIPSRLIQATDLQNAVEQAQVHSRPGSVVLLSPAAASFPRFRSFEERGEQFAKAAGFTVLEAPKLANA